MLTARQYGEVVLPDASTGQSPGTLARKLSRCKEGMARVFAVQVLIWLSITSVALQVILRMGNYPGIVILLTVVTRFGFVKHYGPVMVAGAKAKTVTNNLPILSVLACVFYFYHEIENLSFKYY